jgi:hypothetical protein
VGRYFFGWSIWPEEARQDGPPSSGQRSLIWTVGSAGRRRDPRPHRILITALDRAVQTVFFHGARVTDHGRILTMDHAGALLGVAEGQKRTLQTGS